MPAAQDKKILIMDVAGAFLAVEMKHVGECVAASKITPIAGLPNYILGLASVRGKILTVIDPAIRFELGMGLRRYFLVCNVRGRNMAIAIDQPVSAGLLHCTIGEESKLSEFSNKELRQAILQILHPESHSEKSNGEEVRISFAEQLLEINPDEFIANRDFIASAAG